MRPKEHMKISTVVSPLSLDSCPQNAGHNFGRVEKPVYNSHINKHPKHSICSSSLTVTSQDEVKVSKSLDTVVVNICPKSIHEKKDLLTQNNENNSTCGDYVKKHSFNNKDNAFKKSNGFETVDPLLDERCSVSPEIILESSDSSSSSENPVENKKTAVATNEKKSKSRFDQEASLSLATLSSDLAESCSVKQSTASISTNKLTRSCRTSNKSTSHTNKRKSSNITDVSDSSCPSTSTKSTGKCTRQGTQTVKTEDQDDTSSPISVSSQLSNTPHDMNPDDEKSYSNVLVIDSQDFFQGMVKSNSSILPTKMNAVENQTVDHHMFTIPDSQSSFLDSKLISRQKTILNCHEVDLDEGEPSSAEGSVNRENREESGSAEKFGDNIIDQEILSALQECFDLEDEMIPDSQLGNFNQSSSGYDYGSEIVFNSPDNKSSGKIYAHASTSGGGKRTSDSLSPILSNFSKDSCLTTPHGSQTKKNSSPTSVRKRVVFELDNNKNDHVSSEDDTSNTSSKRESKSDIERNTVTSVTEQTTESTSSTSRSSTEEKSKDSSRQSTSKSKTATSEKSRSTDTSRTTTRTLRSRTSGREESSDCKSVKSNGSKTRTISDIDDTSDSAKTISSEKCAKSKNSSPKSKNSPNNAAKQEPRRIITATFQQAEIVMIENSPDASEFKNTISKNTLHIGGSTSLMMEGKRLFDTDKHYMSSQESDISSSSKSDKNCRPQYSLDYLKCLPGRQPTSNRIVTEQTSEQLLKPEGTDSQDMFASPIEFPDDLTKLFNDNETTAINEYGAPRNSIDEQLDLINDKGNLDTENLEPNETPFIIVNQTNKANQENNEEDDLASPAAVKSPSNRSVVKCPDLVTKSFLKSCSNANKEAESKQACSFGNVVKKTVKTTGDNGSDDKPSAKSTKEVGESNVTHDFTKGDKFKSDHGPKRLIDTDNTFINSQDSQLSTMDNSPLTQQFTKTEIKMLPGRSLFSNIDKNLQGGSIINKNLSHPDTNKNIESTITYLYDASNNLALLEEKDWFSPPLNQKSGKNSDIDLLDKQTEAPLRRSSRKSTASNGQPAICDPLDTVADLSRKKSKSSDANQKKKRTVGCEKSSPSADKPNEKTSVKKQTKSTGKINSEEQASPNDSSQQKKFFSSSFAERHKNVSYDTKGCMKLPFDDRMSDANLFGINKKTFYKSKSLLAMAANKNKDKDKENKVQKGDGNQLDTVNGQFCKRGVKRGLSVKKTDTENSQNTRLSENKIACEPSANTKRFKQKKRQSGSPFSVWHDSDEETKKILIEDYDEAKKKKVQKPKPKEEEMNMNDSPVCKRSMSEIEPDKFSSSSSCSCSSCKKAAPLLMKKKKKSFTPTPNVSSESSASVKTNMEEIVVDQDTLQDTIQNAEELAETIRKNTSDQLSGKIRNSKDTEICQNEREIICRCLEKSSKSIITLSEMLQEIGLQFVKLSEDLSTSKITKLPSSQPEE